MTDSAEVVRGYDAVDVETVSSGQSIFRAGTVGQYMYVVLEGQVEITVGGRVVDRVLPGGIFGEMALIDGGTRTGGAVAALDGKLLRLGEQEFLKLVHESPMFSLKVLRAVTHRLRRANLAAATPASAPPPAPAPNDDELVP